MNFNLGDGANTLVFTHATVTGRVSVKGGANSDSVQLSSDTLGSVAVDTGAGDDIVGVAYAKDLLRHLHAGKANAELANIMREPYFVDMNDHVKNWPMKWL